MMFDEETTEVWIATPTHGLVNYKVVREAQERIAQGVATGADVRLVNFCLRVLFKK